MIQQGGFDFDEEPRAEGAHGRFDDTPGKEVDRILERENTHKMKVFKSCEDANEFINELEQSNIKCYKSALYDSYEVSADTPDAIEVVGKNKTRYFKRKPTGEILVTIG